MGQKEETLKVWAVAEEEDWDTMDPEGITTMATTSRTPPVTLFKSLDNMEGTIASRIDSAVRRYRHQITLPEDAILEVLVNTSGSSPLFLDISPGELDADIVSRVYSPSRAYLERIFMVEKAADSGAFSLTVSIRSQSSRIVFWDFIIIVQKTVY